MGKENQIFMGSDALLQASDIVDVETGTKLNTCTITISIFDGVLRYPVSILAFTLGGTQEVQTSTLPAVLTAGTYTLTYKGETTAAINHDATTAQIKAALELLGTVGVDDIIPEAAHEPDTTLTCTWTFKASLGDVGMLSMDCSSATPATDPTWAETVQGGVGIVAGDIIEGTTSGATAVVDKVDITSGYWMAGTAAGQLEISGQDNTFVAENLRIGGVENVATIPAGDSTGLAVVLLGSGQVKIPMNTVGLTVDDFIRIESTKKYDEQYDIDALDAGQAGYVTITAVNVAETFKGTEVIYIGIPNGKDLSLTHDAVGPPPDDDGYYDGIQPSNLEGVFEGNVYYLFEKIVYSGSTVFHRYSWNADYYSNLKTGT